jgi:Glycosyltransferase family 10 (fucosyltransferase) C-term
MTLVRIVKDWNFPNLLRQLPDGDGSHEWDGVQFTLDAVTTCDYLIVFNRIPEDLAITCPPEHIWCITQEPPVPEYTWLQQGFSAFHRVFTQYENLTDTCYTHSHGALPWWVGKSYTELKCLPAPEKVNKLAWITSNATGRPGHQQRMAFLKHIQSQLDFDLWGKGFQPLDDKWDGLAPYRYALAIENHSSPYYWTEKLMDCFLSWTMPIYYGCTNIDDYFPAEALLKIDINQPQAAIEIIREALASDLWLKNRDAIAYARELCLDKHQFFPFIVNEIRQFEAQHPTYPAKQVHLQKLPYLYGVGEKPKPSPLRRVLSRAKRIVKKLLP